MLLANVNSVHIRDVLREPSLSIRELQVIAGHLTLSHSAIFGKGPVFQAVAPLPLHPIVAIAVLIPELDGDLVVRESKQFLAKAVVVLLVPLGCQELDDSFRALEKAIAVAPDAVRCVRFGYLLGVAKCMERMSGAMEWLSGDKRRTECSTCLALSSLWPALSLR